MAVPQIAAHTAKQMVDEGALLIDIREDAEHARAHIPGAYHVALSRLDPELLAGASGKTVIFHCRSGARTRAHGPRLAAGAGKSCKVYLLEGGLEAWRAAGLPVVTEPGASPAPGRVTRLAAGALALLGAILGVLVSSWFWTAPALVALFWAAIRLSRPAPAGAGSQDGLPNRPAP